MRIIIFTLTLYTSFLSFGQTGIQGITKSTSGDILPFSTIYIKGTTNGTTSNSEGEYFLKTPAGHHIIISQHVGYKIFEKKITLSEGQKIRFDFVLQEQVLTLDEVIITSGDKDPAYRVIREAMKKRKFYKNEISAFKTNVYLKGLFRLDDKPDKILGQKIMIDTGIVYLSESVSEFSFELPNKISERMISSKVSGDDQGFSFNTVSDFNINAYNKFIDLGMEREYVSPISPQTFLFYDFKLQGFFEEGGKWINKIKLIPKRATDPVFEGVIYIVEDEWRLHTIDFTMTKARGLEFIDSLKINQVFAPTKHDIWMPLSQKVSFTFGTFGFKGSGYYIGIYSNYKIEPNYAAYKEANLYAQKFGGKEETDLFQKTDFSSEVLVVEKESNKRDTTYWKDIRPLPLTEIEIADYHIKDSIQLVKESIPYKDSIDRETNKLSFGKIFLTGYNFSNTKEEKDWHISPVISIFQFNTVEGFIPEIQPTIRKKVDGRTKYSIRPAIRYGFSNEKFNAKLTGSYRRLDNKFTQFNAGGGRYTAQFDESEAIDPFINSLVTLVNGENYKKIFQKAFGYVGFQQELKNGIHLNTRLEYASRDTLTNTTDFTWVSNDGLNFTSNQPANMELAKTGFSSHQALIFEANFRFSFKQTYETRAGRKNIYGSKYPEVFLTYKKGIKALGSDVDFDFVEAKVTDDMKLGLVGVSSYQVGVGAFLNDNALTFIDYKHFSGNQTSLSIADESFKFELLPFYQFSTTKPYFEIHYEHHFNEFIFNKIPLVKKLNLQAVASANYLTTKTIGDYLELGVGIEHIFKFLRVDYYWAFRDNDFFANRIIIGIGF